MFTIKQKNCERVWMELFLNLFLYLQQWWQSKNIIIILVDILFHCASPNQRDFGRQSGRRTFFSFFFFLEVKPAPLCLLRAMEWWEVRSGDLKTSTDKDWLTSRVIFSRQYVCMFDRVVIHERVIHEYVVHESVIHEYVVHASWEHGINVHLYTTLP